MASVEAESPTEGGGGSWRSTSPSVKTLLGPPTTPVAFGLSLVVGLLLIAYWFLRRDSRVKKMLDKLPGPRAFPIVGNSLIFHVPPTQILRVLNSLVEKYGRLYRLWMFNLPYVVVASAKDAQIILSSTVHINKSRDYDVMRPWLGNPLTLKEGRDWSIRRKFLTPAFNFGLHEEFLAVFNEQGEVFKKVIQDECVGKDKVNLHPYCFRLSLDVICETAMGTKLQVQTKKNVKYLKTMMGMTALIAKRILQPWLQPNFLWWLSGKASSEQKHIKILQQFTDNVIVERKKARAMELEKKTVTVRKEGEAPRRLAFLDLILEASRANGGGLSDVEIRNETDLFMGAGHDTSGTALSWTLFLLAHNPEEQARVQEELDEIFGDDPTRKVTPEDLSRMQYLEMCMKESLRLRASIPVIFRKIQSDLTLSDGMKIPRGTTVAISIWNIHMDPEVYPDPEKFDPLRFTAENSSQRNAYAFIPFAAGPRNCIGQSFARLQIKTALSWALRAYTFIPAEPLDEVEVVPDVNIRPINGLNFSVIPRRTT